MEAHRENVHNTGTPGVCCGHFPSFWSSHYLKTHNRHFPWKPKQMLQSKYPALCDKFFSIIIMETRFCKTGNWHLNTLVIKILSTFSCITLHKFASIKAVIYLTDPDVLVSWKWDFIELLLCHNTQQQVCLNMPSKYTQACYKLGTEFWWRSCAVCMLPCFWPSSTEKFAIHITNPSHYHVSILAPLVTEKKKNFYIYSVKWMKDMQKFYLEQILSLRPTHYVFFLTLFYKPPEAPSVHNEIIFQHLSKWKSHRPSHCSSHCYCNISKPVGPICCITNILTLDLVAQDVFGLLGFWTLPLSEIVNKTGHVLEAEAVLGLSACNLLN